MDHESLIAIEHKAGDGQAFAIGGDSKVMYGIQSERDPTRLPAVLGVPDL